MSLEQISKLNILVTNYAKLVRGRNTDELLSHLGLLFGEIVLSTYDNSNGGVNFLGRKLWFCVDRNLDMEFTEGYPFFDSGVDIRCDRLASENVIIRDYITIGVKVLKSASLNIGNHKEFREWLLSNVAAVLESKSKELLDDACTLLKNTRVWAFRETAHQIGYDETCKQKIFNEILPEQEIHYINSPKW